MLRWVNQKIIKIMKLADKPGFVDLIAKADSHSSRRTITCTLELSTRWRCEPHLIKPKFKMPAYLILLRMEVTAFHPFQHKLTAFAARRSNRLVSVALFLASRRTAVSRHPALCSPDFPPSNKLDGDCLASFKCYFNMLMQLIILKFPAQCLSGTQWH